MCIRDRREEQLKPLKKEEQSKPKILITEERRKKNNQNYGRKTVSYTHLDVYKRQHLNTPLIQ